MKKLQQIAVLIFLLAGISNAQSFQGGIAVTAVTPSGNFSDVAGTGYGGVLMAKLGIPIVDVTGSVEYLRFAEKTTDIIKLKSTMWSINAGARISVLPIISVGAELGNYWVTVTTDNGINESDNTENKIAFTPLIAAQFSIFEASIRYAIMDNASFFSIRGGIYF